MVDFSFIIPVYNAGETIERCLNSICAQHHDSFEVIMMDDGSSDDSYDKCRRYQNEDKRFKVFHQENSGPSVARNRCLDYATGDWICFVDSDDTIDVCYLERLYQIIQDENPEVIFFGYKQVNTEEKVEKIKLPGNPKGDYYETLVELSSKDMFGYTWIKCFKRECIGDIRFNEDLNLFEDEVFACNVLKNCRKVSLINEAIYDYYIGSTGTLIQRTHEDYCIKCNEVFLAWERLMEEYFYASTVLAKKADVFVERCQYYSLERPVRIQGFYSDLAKTRYFELCSNSSNFRRYVMNRNYKMLRVKKFLYNLKVKIAKLAGR